MTNFNALQKLNSLLPTLAQQYHRLILIVAPHQGGKTALLKSFSEQHNCPYLNLNLALSQKLLNLAPKKRPFKLKDLSAAILSAQNSPLISLDNIELLFEPILHQDPLNLLQNLSRKQSLIVAWPGQYQPHTTTLSYAVPSHPHYKRYTVPQRMIITLPTLEVLSNA